MPDLLRLDAVSAGYGRARALFDINLTLPVGGTLAVLGRNGVGKTTLINTIIGMTTLHGGRLWLGGVEITRMPSYRRVGRGLGWVPQEREIFSSLTVEENITAVARPGAWTLQRIYRLFPRLRERRTNMGGQLSGGEQQMLAIGRALALNPALLLLDEPLEGLAPVIVEELLAAIRDMIADSGLAVVIVEQHASHILPLTQQAIVLLRGRIVHCGDSPSLLTTPKMLSQWLAAQHGEDAAF